MFKKLNPLMTEAVAADPVAGGGGGADTSLLAAGGAPATPATPAPINEFVPEKFHVFKGDGDGKEFDVEGTLRKATESYTALEKHKGPVLEIPKTPEEYAFAVDIPDFDFNTFKADPQTQSFLKGAHGKGMTNEQVAFVTDHFYKNIAPELVAGARQLDATAADAELRKHWKSDEDFNKNLNGSFRAFASISEKAGISLEDAEKSGIADNPTFLRLMAAMASELEEDPGVNGGDGNPNGGEDIATLLASDAYRNPKHADHTAASEKVKAYYKKNFPG